MSDTTPTQTSGVIDGLFWIELPGDDCLNVGVWSKDPDKPYPVVAGVCRSPRAPSTLGVIELSYPWCAKARPRRADFFVQIAGPARNLTRDEYRQAIKDAA